MFARVCALLLLSTLAAQAEVPGTLVIVGGGKLPSSVRAEFFRLAGGKERARIVVLPTASVAADRASERESFQSAWKELGPISVQILHTRDRKQADDAAFVQPLIDATAVWISGGDQNRLIAAYRGTLVEQELHRLLLRGGVIGGTSAGAAVMSDPMIEGGTDEARTGPGFGFLKGIVVDQHFVARNRIGRLRGVLTKQPDLAGLGVDEGTAAIVRGTTLTVLGDSTVTAIGSQSSAFGMKEHTLKSGDRFDLTALHERNLPAPVVSLRVVRPCCFVCRWCVKSR